MNTNWNLDILYKGFEDPKYSKDLEELKNVIKELNSLLNGDLTDKLHVIEEELKLEERLTALVGELYNYCSLRLSTNVNDTDAMNNCGVISFILQDTVEASVKFEKLLRDVNLDELRKQSKYVDKYYFNLSNAKKDASHLLSDKEEILASKLRSVGSDSWSSLQSQLTSNLMIKVEGFDEKMPLSAVRNLAYSADKKVRINAYNAELKAYDQIKDSVAMALNNIKREVNIFVPLRGYKDALDMTLEQSHMSKATLDAMIEAIKEEAPNFRKYFKLKAKALGYSKGLPFYELFAPMGSLTKTYTIEEAKKEVLDVYRSFSEPLYQMGKTAFENRWIDFLPKEGKEGGAFCAGIDNHKQSRVLTNFTGSLGDIQTLAHELGHAYHGQVCLNNDILNRDYPMQLAETASIFCQTMLSKKMMTEFSDPKELLTIVDNSLQEDTQCVIDILSRYLFETDVLNQPVSRTLSSDDLCKMMLKAQDESYGDGLDPEYRHPYMWLNKSHYYSAGLNFYNWPYAFGLLYAKGLYKQYLSNKEEFVKHYDTMLENTGKMCVEDVTASMNIDVTKKDFWIGSLKFIEEDITLFEKLLKELHLI